MMWLQLQLLQPQHTSDLREGSATSQCGRRLGQERPTEACAGDMHICAGGDPTRTACLASFCGRLPSPGMGNCIAMHAKVH